MHIRICCSTGDLALLGDLGENPSGLVVLDVQHLARGSGHHREHFVSMVCFIYFGSVFVAEEMYGWLGRAISYIN